MISRRAPVQFEANLKAFWQEMRFIGSPQEFDSEATFRCNQVTRRSLLADNVEAEVEVSVEVQVEV